MTTGNRVVFDYNSTPYITGVGLVTPLGRTATATWDALLKRQFSATHARVDLEFDARLARVSHLAIRAAREAVQASNASSLRDAALIIGTSKGPIEQWLKPPSTSPLLERSVDFGLSQIASDVAREFNVAGPRLTVSTACASGLHALIRGAMMIRTGEVRQALVVAAEASVHPLFIASFERLGIIPPEGIGCRPFDRTRQGFLMSEAAAAVLLEADSSDVAAVAVERFAMGADATHLTRNSDDAEPLRRVLNHVWHSRPVDLFHAHGTGTIHNDATELAVIEKLAAAQGDPAAGQRGPAGGHLYSHKGALGHSLGAAGLVSVVLNVMSHRYGIVPPNVQTRDPLAMTHIRISSEAISRPVHRSIAVAAGFGGQIAAVALASKVR
jgi:3-oxoacyl-[acyl-carrier-protein] synthase II